MYTAHVLCADRTIRCAVPLEEALAAGEGASVWVDIEGPDTRDLALLAETFGFHPLAIEDTHHLQKRAKFERFPTHEFLVLTALDRLTRDDLFDVVPVCVFIRARLVVTVRPKRVTAVERVVNALRGDPGRVGNTVDRVIHALADAVVDELTPLLDDLEDQLDRLSDGHPTGPSLLNQLLQARRQLLLLRRLILPEIEVLRRLLDRETEDAETRAFFRDVLDHLLSVSDETQLLLDLANGAISAHANAVNERTNEVMKVLAIASTLALPFTVCSGIYGMNFERIPGAAIPWGFGVAVGSMVAAAALLVVYFRVKRWLGIRTLLPEEVTLSLGRPPRDESPGSRSR